jgi:hypothetical protein
LDCHSELNNKKVEHLAVAHRAMVSFLSGFVILVGLITLTALVQPPTSDDLVRHLRSNQLVRELLRGPRGEPGAPGQPCGPCAQPQPATTAAGEGEKHVPPTVRPSDARSAQPTKD